MSMFAFKNSRGESPSEEDFVFKLGTPKVDIPADKAEARRRFKGVGYTGDMIFNHPYWGNVVFDLSLMNVPEKMPILRDHYLERIVGHSDKFEISTQTGLELEGFLSKSTPFGQEVIALSDEGFPWQMSVRIKPDRIEEVSAGASFTVNGKAFTGPAIIFRESNILETSFTPTGWDRGTSASAMSRTNKEEDTQMSKELEDKIKELTGKIETLEAANKQLTDANTELAKSVEAFNAAAKEVIKNTITEAFKNAGRELTDTNLVTLCALPKEALDIMLASMQPAEKKTEQQLPEGLFAHQAEKGKQEPNAAEAMGKGLLACCDSAANEFKTLQGMK